MGQSWRKVCSCVDDSSGETTVQVPMTRNTQDVPPPSRSDPSAAAREATGSAMIPHERPQQFSDSESIREWLDEEVKPGFAAKFATVFEDVGVDDVADLNEINDEMMKLLETDLVAAGAKPIVRKKKKKPTSLSSLAKNEGTHD